MANTSTQIYGVRHHGPGSARTLLHALAACKPDIILLEGPPDAQEVLSLCGHEEMEPPVALLVYAPDNPGNAVFYPFATFSPEWQAIRFGLKNNIPVRFMDLPQMYQLQDEKEQQDKPEEKDEEIRQDPIGFLAKQAGYTDGERWWDHVVENRQDSSIETFQAIQEAMAALREQFTTQDTPREQQREAYMRRTIRQASKEGFENIAVICGAWHGPALAQMPPVKHDDELLKGLTKIKTEAAWVPWSYDRLSYWSGYGAGVNSPEWYHLLWSQQQNLVTLWITRAARLMREHDIDVSPAHVIETVRLAETLAFMRSRALPNLEELDEAVRTVMCMGEEAPLQIIRKHLIVGLRLGKVPEDAPVAPLQNDFMKLQKRLRLPLKVDDQDYDFDLRNANDLERSHLLHRLGLLNIFWGQLLPTAGKKAGTFHEYWRLRWKPEYIIGLIEASRYGNTIEEAATGKCIDSVNSSSGLKPLTELLNNALLADLPKAVSVLMRAIQERTAGSGDVWEMMQAIGPLARVMRYGNVRQTDTDMLWHVVDGLAERIFINLPGACSSLNDESAYQMAGYMNEVHSAISLLQDENWTKGWIGVLGQLSTMKICHHLLQGRAGRLLYDSGNLEKSECGRLMSLALSSANDPNQAGAWVEGFLSGSGLILIHDQVLWNIIFEWVSNLNDDHFTSVLPLMRRTFANFSKPERKQMGDRVRKGVAVLAGANVIPGNVQFDFERANSVLPILSQILGMEIKH